MKPELTGKLSSYISIGKTVELSYYTTSILQKSGDIEYSIKNVLSDYDDIIKAYTVNITMDDKEYNLYCYKPELLSYNLYKTTDLFFVLLYINNICDRRDFKRKKIKIIHPDNIGIINQIFVTEYERIQKNRYNLDNSEHLIINTENKLINNNISVSQEHMIYYGTSKDAVYNDTLLRNLNKETVYSLDNLKFTVNASGKLIYFIAPSSLGLYKFITETSNNNSILSKIKMIRLKHPDTGLMINYNIFRSETTTYDDKLEISLIK